MFQAWCDAYVENVAYNDMCEVTNRDPAESEIPSEEAMHRLASDTVGHELARRAFDYDVFELLWPRRDTSTLDDMTRPRSDLRSSAGSRRAPRRTPAHRPDLPHRS